MITPKENDFTFVSGVGQLAWRWANLTFVLNPHGRSIITCSSPQERMSVYSCLSLEENGNRYPDECLGICLSDISTLSSIPAYYKVFQASACYPRSSRSANHYFCFQTSYWWDEYLSMAHGNPTTIFLSDVRELPGFKPLALEAISNEFKLLLLRSCTWSRHWHYRMVCHPQCICTMCHRSRIEQAPATELHYFVEFKSSTSQYLLAPLLYSK